MNGIKFEDSKVKPEPASPRGLIDEDDIDIEEDSGELQIPPETMTARGWLTQVPKELWTALAEMTTTPEFARLNDDDRIDLGEMKVWTPEEGSQQQSNVLRLIMKSNLPGFKMIPKEYDVDVKNGDVKNMFVFTEKNLAGFKPAAARKRDDKSKGRFGGGKFSGMSKADRYRRGPKTIPKHTALYAVPEHEAKATPRENDEWLQLQLQKQAELDKDRDKSIFGDLTVSDSHSMIVDARDLGQKSVWTGLTTKATAKKLKPQENKAARIPENELMQMLFELFSGEFQYFPMKVLKQRTRQPEAFLREVLVKIGRLVKSGPAANTWTLKSEWMLAKGANWAALVPKEEDEGTGVKDTQVANDLGSDDDDGDDFDDDDEMEDVGI